MNGKSATAATSPKAPMALLNQPAKSAEEVRDQHSSRHDQHNFSEQHMVKNTYTIQRDITPAPSARAVVGAFHGLSTVAKVQQETAATNVRSGGFGCVYSRLARHE
jgi:hypothetical protein